jgi:hypothetical protein
MAAGRRAPIGALDVVRESARTSFEARGWTFDPDQTGRSIQVRIDVDGVPALTKAADLSRTDVARVYGTPTDRFGFTVPVTVTEGAHEVCAYGLDGNDGRPAKLGCAQIVARPAAIGGTRAPIGHLDELGWADGSHFVRGWSFDPDHRNASVQVRVEVDGKAAVTAAATAVRPDVQRVYGTTFAGYGYRVPVKLPSGSHRVCVLAIDLDTAKPTSLGCVTVTAG